MAQRIIGAAAVALEVDGELVEYQQREEVDLDAEVEATLDETPGALVPKEFDSFEAYESYKQDVYRSGRGDLTAAGNLAESRSGGIPDIDSIPAQGADVPAFAAWLEAEGPNAGETVAAAEDDPGRAQAILDAESQVTGSKPRKAVETALQKIIDG